MNRSTPWARRPRSRAIFIGKVTQLQQSGTQNGYTASVTRNFAYDANLRMCWHQAPEFGKEVFVYDAEGLLVESGRGSSASGCVGSVDPSIRVTHTYSLGRATQVNRFGSLFAAYGYHTAAGQAGMLAYEDNALLQRTSYNSYKRGIAQSVTRSAGSSTIMAGSPARPMRGASRELAV